MKNLEWIKSVTLMNLLEQQSNMCLAFIYKVDKYDKKTKKVIVSHDALKKEVINPYQIDIKVNDQVKIQMGIILEVVDETSY